MKIILRNKWIYVCMLVLGLSTLTACQWNRDRNADQDTQQSTQQQPMTLKEIQSKCHQDCQGQQSRTRCYNDCVRYHKDMMKRDGRDASMDQGDQAAQPARKTKSDTSY